MSIDLSREKCPDEIFHPFGGPSFICLKPFIDIEISFKTFILRGRILKKRIGTIVRTASLYRVLYIDRAFVQSTLPLRAATSVRRLQGAPHAI